MATSTIRQRSEYNVKSRKQKLQQELSRHLQDYAITAPLIHPSAQIAPPGWSSSYLLQYLTNLQHPPKRPARRAPALSPRSRIMSRTLTEKALGAMSAARRRLKRISVRGASRQAVIHKTLRQGCALGSAASRRHSFWRPRAGAVEWSHSRELCREKNGACHNRP